MRRLRTASAVLVTGLLAASAAAQVSAPTPAPVPPPTPTPVPREVPELVGDYLAAADAGAREKALERLLQRRAELNVRNHEPAALALIRHGISQQGAGDAEAARQTLQGAVQLAPDLPDAHFALSRAGGGGALSGYTADLNTRAGVSRLLTFAIACLVCGVLGTVTALGLALLVRHGRLLFHDLRENASSSSLEALAPGLAAVILLLPLVLFQGWGWVPLWWLAVLFAYMSRGERVGALAALILAALLAPALTLIEQRQALDANPLLWSGLRTLQSAADPRDLQTLEEARRVHGDDRDLAYLVGLQHEKAGRSAEAEGVYASVLRETPDDPVALNNLARIEIYRGDTARATRHLRKVADSPAADWIRGTALYNLSILSLQLFDFDAAAALRRQADGLASGETSRYESQWSYETPEGSAVSAPVSLGPKPWELEAKLAGASGDVVVARTNLTGTGARVSALPGAAAWASRLVGFIAVFVMGLLGMRFWRGGLLLTRRCLKCGEPFSRRTRAGVDAGELCNPCYHLYVVKDGISVPARRAKMGEVDSWERRSRITLRFLSLLSPGAGHGFAGSALGGLLIGLVWYASLGGLLLLRTGVLPLVDAPASLGGSLPFTVLAVVAGLFWLIGNLTTPSLDRPLPSRRAARRAVAA